MNIADRIRLGFDRFNARDWEAVTRGLPGDLVRAAVRVRATGSGGATAPRPGRVPPNWRIPTIG